MPYASKKWAGAVSSKVETFEDTPKIYMMANCVKLSFGVFVRCDEFQEEYGSPPPVDLLPSSEAGKERESLPSARTKLTCQP